MSAKKLLILGAGANSIEVLDTVHDINDRADRPRFECIGFLDDREALWGTMIDGVPVLGPLAGAQEHPEAWIVNGTGSSLNYWKREALIARVGVPRDRYVTLVHPTATVSRTSVLGLGIVVFQNVAITAHARIGDHVVLRPNALVSHHVQIGDYSSITGGVCVSGGGKIGRSCYLGTNCTIRDGVTVGDRSLIGMGSVVLHDVEPNSLMFGNPAKFQRRAVADGE